MREIVHLTLAFVIGVVVGVTAIGIKGYNEYERFTRELHKGVAEACEDDRVIQAHRYHGILISQNRDGERTFTRNGKTCKLFTQAFNEWYERKQHEKTQSRN